MLPLDNGHNMSYQEFGNPDGIPVLYLHGGPGGRTPSFIHQLFDPQAFRIITYDQRGAGNSTPAGETAHNTPDILVQDIETLRQHLGIEQWHVCGGSWGTTLALLYAEEHPDHVKSLTLRGLFMMRKSEVDWFIDQMGIFFPKIQKEFVDYIPKEERGNLLDAYYQRLMDPDPAVHMPAAHVWARHENLCASLFAKAAAPKSGHDQDVLNIARMEAHFFHNHMFTPDDRILQNVGRIRHIPTTIIQGQYDMICPPFSAFDLKQAFPEAELKMVLAGHATTDPEILNAMLETMDRIRDTTAPAPKTQAKTIKMTPPSPPKA